jgi:protein TilB
VRPPPHFLRPDPSHRNCEFLKKLDLTVNFVDLDELEESISHLQSRLNLKDLYMMGNPAETNWPNFKSFVIAKLPQLQTLDGTEITKSMRIIATQSLPSLEVSHLPSALI